MTPPTDATALVARVRRVLDSTLDDDGDETLLHEPSGHIMYARRDDGSGLDYLSVGDVRSLLSLVAQGEADRERLEAMPVVGPITFSCGCQVMTRMEQRFSRKGEHCDAPDHVLDAARATPTEGPTHG